MVVEEEAPEEDAEAEKALGNERITKEETREKG